MKCAINDVNLETASASLAARLSNRSSSRTCKSPPRASAILAATSSLSLDSERLSVCNFDRYRFRQLAESPEENLPGLSMKSSAEGATLSPIMRSKLLPLRNLSRRSLISLKLTDLAHLSFCCSRFFLFHPSSAVGKNTPRQGHVCERSVTRKRPHHLAEMRCGKGGAERDSQVQHCKQCVFVLSMGLRSPSSRRERDAGVSS